jgi:hypothetical protein
MALVLTGRDSPHGKYGQLPQQEEQKERGFSMNKRSGIASLAV